MIDKQSTCVVEDTLIGQHNLVLVKVRLKLHTAATCSDWTSPHLKIRSAIVHIRQKLESNIIAESHWTSRVSSNSRIGKIHFLLAQANQPRHDEHHTLISNNR